MIRRIIATPGLLSVLVGTLSACVASNVEKYAVADPSAIRGEFLARPSAADSALYTFTGPAIHVRAGYGEFARGMFKGGSEFGSSISLQGRQTADHGLAHRFLATIQYTNLGGVYRGYDQAGIEGVEGLRVTTIARNKEFTINGVIMSETLAVEIDDASLREHRSGDIELRIGTESGHVEDLRVPRNYVVAYLDTIEAFLATEAVQ